MRLRRIPAEVQDLAGDQRVLAWAAVDDGWVVTTHDRLLLPGREPLGWQDVVRAAWDAPVLEVKVPGGLVRVVLDAPGNIPEVVNERVKASVLVQQHVALIGDKGVRLVARRKPGDTAIMWRVTFDAGVDANDPAVRAAADDALAELRASLGL
ncbi:MAG: hypothetical protein KDC17_00710 [Actinobacteria bacterium]|nr:hypothetical protein [Actinomycetota bacterium]